MENAIGGTRQRGKEKRIKKWQMANWNFRKKYHDEKKDSRKTKTTRARKKEGGKKNSK